MKCNICGKEINKYGDEACPVSFGKCCDECNLKIVVSARIILAKIKVGDTIKINKMLNGPKYDNTTGVV